MQQKLAKMPSLVKDETEPVPEGAQPGDDLLNHPDFKSTLENAKHEFSKTKLKVIRKYQPWKLEAGKEGREKFKRNERERQDPHGAVYLGHIPHGFFEKQIESFFSQFGRVTRVNLARSKKTGRSKGYAFVEFDHPEVAKVVAETMNNYLLFERLLKAQYVPPEKIHKGMFPDEKSFEDGFCPTIKRRIKQVKLQDEAMTPEEVEKNRKRIQKSLKATLGKLKDLGIDYQPQVFDPPTDEVPELVLSQKRKHGNEADNEPKSKKNKKLKKKAINVEPKEVSDALEKTKVKPRPFIAKKLKEKKTNGNAVLQSEPANVPTEVVEPIVVAEKAFTLGAEVASPKKSSQKRQKWKKNKKAAALATNESLTEATQPISLPESVAEVESAAPKKKKKKNRKTRQAQNGANVQIVTGEVSEVTSTESGTEKAKKKRKKKSGKKSAPEN